MKHTDPNVLPRLFGPTVSSTKAKPIVQTTAALMPCNARATISTGTLWPRESIIVAPESASSPSRKGACRVDTRSAITPARGEKRTDAPAYAARMAET